MATELPASGVPAAHAARPRAHPDEAGCVLIEGHHERIAKRRAVVRLVPIVGELARGTIEQREPFGRADPDAPRLIFEQRAHVVAGERGSVARVVTEGLEDAAVVIHTHEACVERGDPKRAGPILEHARDFLVAQGIRGAGRRTDATQRARLGAPTIQAAVRADPDVARAVERERQDVIAGKRSGIVGVIPQVFDASRERIEHVDAGIARADPYLTARIDEHGPNAVARERARVVRVMPIGREAVRAAIPFRDAAVLDRDPEVRVGVLDDLPNEVAGQGAALRARARVAIERVCVEAHETVFRPEPHETLRVL